MVRNAALENPVVKFVCKILENNPNLTGVEIGGRVAGEFECEWVPRSKQRNGAALARWAAWLGTEWSENIAAQNLQNVDQIVERLKSLRPEEFGTLPLIRRFSGERDKLRHGRPSLISDELLQAIIILQKETDMPMTEIAARVGISRATIYRTLDRQ